MLALADPETAAALMREHLDVLWNSGRFRELRSGCIFLDDLHVVIPLLARNPSRSDHYFVKLGGEYYDVGPPSVEFVEPSGLEVARHGSRWFPNLRDLENFKLHDQYGFPDGQRQLICFSLSAGYYQSNHTPTEGQQWQKGVHTLAGTVNRIATVLSTEYEGPSG